MREWFKGERPLRRFPFLFLFFLLFIIPFSTGLIIRTGDIITKVSGGNSSDVNFTTDSGGGVILDTEVFTFTGTNGISTSGSGNTVTIDGSGVAGASDTNESTRVLEMVGDNCAGTSKAVGFYANGSVQCSADIDTDTYNSTSDIQSVPVGGEVSGTVGSITINNDALDDQYYDSEADLTTLLNDNYCPIAYTTNSTWYRVGVYPNMDTDSTDDFSGSWNDLADIPAGFADDTDDEGTFTNGTAISVSNIISLSWANVTITESQITDLAHTTDTNETVRVSALITKVDNNNASMKAYVDANDADTTYTAGDALTLDGTEFNFDGGASPGGELGGTWASPTLDHDALDDQYYDSEADLTGLLNDNYLSLAYGTNSTWYRVATYPNMDTDSTDDLSSVNVTSVKHARANITTCMQIGTLYLETNASDALIISTTPC